MKTSCLAEAGGYFIVPLHGRGGQQQQLLQLLLRGYGGGSIDLRGRLFDHIVRGSGNRCISRVNAPLPEDARAGMKVFSAWPTFPQLYVRGAFVGGLDVMREMHEGGELAPLMSGLTATAGAPPA